MQPNNQIGAAVLVVPLTDRWHKNFQPMEANSEVATPNAWFDASDIQFQIQRPTFSREVDTAPVPVKARVLNPSDFMKGGIILE